MKKHQKITLALASASYSLMGVSSNVQAEVSPDYDGWDIKSAFLFYSE